MRGVLAAALLLAGAVLPASAQAEAGKILFLMRADPPGGSADPQVKARLEQLGYTVTVGEGLPAMPDPCGFDLVVMSSTVRSNQFTAQHTSIERLREMGVPLVTWENDLLDDLWMTGLRRDSDFGELETGHYFWLVRAPHPMAAGVPAGLGTWTEARTPAGWGKPGLGADVIMTWPGEPDKATLFGYEAGATMDHDHLAPARRVFIGMENNSFTRMTDTGGNRLGQGRTQKLRSEEMKQIASIAFAVAGLLPFSAAAQEGAIPEPKPLVARYTAQGGRLTVGGGPEAEQVAAVLKGRLTVRISGPTGAVPLLTQGVVLLAVLPRELTPIESAGVRRFSGGAPLAVAIMQDLRIYVRRDKTGAVDAKVLPILNALLTDSGQTALANSLSPYKPLTPAELDETRRLIAALPTASYPDGPAGYRAPDGSMAIVGSDTLTELLPDLLQAYARHAPQDRFITDLRGSSTAMPALTAGTSLIAPMGREAWDNDLDAFRQAKGYGATRIRIAYASHGPRPDGKTPPAIYVNASSPLKGLSLDQVRRIFAAGADGGDIADWGQLTSSPGPIHVYGARDDGGFGTAMRQSKLDGLPFSARYRAMPSGKAILATVAKDPLAIGYATWMDAGEAPAGVRLLPLSKRQGLPYVLPEAGAHRGEWPISYFFNVYVDKRPGTPLTGEAKRLLRLLLSDEGQAVIASHSGEEDGYVPLDKTDLTAERALVEAL